ncbi:MAG: sugar porter family MFS transporter [Planctomycetota bacterium]|nr:sugar porter family MFS transporter [Planctomycetota bacterium]
MSQSPRSTVRSSLVVALGGFLLGFDSAVVSGVMDPVQKAFTLNSDQVGFTASCLILGAMIGNALAGPLANRFGRRAILIVTALLFTVSAAWSGLATSFSTLVIARVIGGLGVGAAILIAPIYIAEIAPPASRGRLVSFNQLNIVIGISAAFFSNYFINDGFDATVAWRWMLGVEAVPAFLYFVLLFTVPCSPRWLLSTGRRGEAEQAISRLGGDATDIAGFMGGAEENHRAARGNVGELFSSRMRRILTLALALAFFQQITGINAIFYYAATIFGKAGAATESALMQGILIGLTNLVFTLVALRLIDRAGRRPLLLVGSAGMAIALLTTAFAFRSATYELTPLIIEQSRTDKQAALLAPLEGTTFETEEAFIAALDGEAAKRGVAGVELEAFYENKEAIVELAASDETDTATYTLSGDALAEMASNEGLARLEGAVGVTHTDRGSFMDAIKTAAGYAEMDDADRKKFDEGSGEVSKKALVINGPLVLIAIMLFIASFAVSLGPVMWAMLSEVFPMHLRGAGISVAGLFNSAVSFTVVQLFPRSLSDLGPDTTFMIFGLFAVGAFLFTWKMVPETKGRSLEELERELIIE